MQFRNDAFIFSPSDLVAHLACEHLTQLERLAATGQLDRPTDDRSDVELIRELGDAHERRYLELLRAEGRSIVEISDATGADSLPALHEQTVEAMRAGNDVIFQATFFDGTWRGHVDFLIRTDQMTPAGHPVYEPFDTKLARSEKVSALVQLADYALHLEAVQGVRPKRVHIVLGDDRISSFETNLLRGYHQRARKRLIDAVTHPAPTSPEPVDHCSVCRWHERCEAEREHADHLIRVAGVGRPQIKSLRRAGITTATELAAAPVGAKPVGMQDDTWNRIRRQARLQRDAAGEPRFELIDPALHPQGGFRLLPEPSPNDLFFDIEGDPYRGFQQAGLEYLWGISDTNDHFDPIWAHDPAEERRAFEATVDRIIEAHGADPSMHVYHYASYEVDVFKRLSARHASRIEELDDLLRCGVFVDLYAVARHAVRTSARRLSIKDLEAFYRDKRDTDVQSGMESVVQYEAWLKTGESPAMRDQAILDDIERYNEDDCVSTRQLRDWLEAQRSALIADGHTIARPAPEVVVPSPESSAEKQRRADLRAALTADHDPTDPESHVRWLLGNLVEFHDRESKPRWWKHFALAAMSPSELWDDTEAVADLDEVGPVGTIKKSVLIELSFDPEQPHKLKVGNGDMVDYAPGPTGKRRGINIQELDAAAGRMVVKQGMKNEAPMPEHLISSQPIAGGAPEAAISDVADAWLGGTGRRRFPAIADLLNLAPPRLVGREALRNANESASDALVRVVGQLDSSCLAVQGPPGTGKTFTGARAIRALVADRKTVGVVSHSHRAIENLLAEVIGDRGAPNIRVLKVGGDDERAPAGCDHESSSSTAADQVLAGDFDVVGGTAWFFARPEIRQHFDVLFVDEAGQMSLANTLAAATAAKSVVLLGDPQQLDQPLQGTHPPEVGRSSLAHYIGEGNRTIPPDRGIFLDDTWRMSAEVCEFVSTNFYDGRLQRSRHAPTRAIRGLDCGTYWSPVEHNGNKARSSEEAEQAAAIAQQLVGLDFVDGDARPRPLTASDIMFITPFNAQVQTLRSALGEVGLDDAEVGTVDLFQGRQAPVVMYSMAASSGELAPRGIDFLFSAHRFNVASSRAQVAAIVIANPSLLSSNAKKPEQIPLVGALCNFVTDASPMHDGTVDA